MDLESVALAYEAMPSDPSNPVVQASYKAFNEALAAQFAAIPVKVAFTASDPYKTSGDLFAAIDGGSYQVFTGGEPHPLLDTLKFRAVHDYIAHYLPRNSFGPKGEFAAWLAHRATLPAAAHMALAIETRGQSAFYFTRGQYAPQKAGIFPAELC